MQTDRRTIRNDVRRRGRTLPPELAGTDLSVRKKRPPPPEVPAIRLKAPIVETKPSPPPLGVPEILALLQIKDEKADEPKSVTQQKIMDATRGLYVLFGTCAGDVTVQLAQGFVDVAVPMLHERFSPLRGSAREEVKDVINKCVRRLSSLLAPAPIERLRTLLERHRMGGTIRRYLDGLPDKPARQTEPRF